MCLLRPLIALLTLMLVCGVAVAAVDTETAVDESAAAVAATEAAVDATETGRAMAGGHDPLSAGNALTVFSSLILVLLVMLALAWLLRRLQTSRPGTGGAITLVSQLPLGTREKVVLLRVGEENVIVGCSPAGVNRVHSWTGDAVVADSVGSANPGFGAALQSVLERGGGSK